MHAFRTYDNRYFNLFLRLLGIVAIKSLFNLSKQCTFNDGFPKGPKAIFEIPLELSFVAADLLTECDNFPVTCPRLYMQLNMDTT